MLNRLTLLGGRAGNEIKKTTGGINSAAAASLIKRASNISRTVSIEAQERPTILQQPNYKYAEGKDYEDFQCIRAEQVPEFGITSYNFVHKRTGTNLWYLDRKDPNNVFSVNFRTTPFDSTGLPHILEHSVLCGSQMYPVRDPFFKMLNRSMATFMNAMTAPDYTLYPFSTMNEVDFRNLQKIYLDAVFRPNLKYLDFLQEGWRLEHVDLKNRESDYVIKGVVYNEMKGAFSENASIFGQNLLNNILPDHTYGYVSGGNPLEIPKLTHANLVDFHKKYYHPSNARIYTYGSFDLNQTLKYVNSEYLSKYECIDTAYSCIPSQKRWTEPRQVHITSRFDTLGADFDKQNQIAVALLMTDVTNVQETFVLYVISELLVRGPNSAFYKSLIEPNFSGGYNQATGYDPQIKDTYFAVGLQDLLCEDFNRVLELFDSTLKSVVQQGFEAKHIESVLHSIELSLKHQSPQFGLGLLFNMSPLWNHEGDVLQSLRISNTITKFRQQLADDPKYLQKKIEEYFVNNTHKLTMTMTPDDNYEQNFKTSELALLKQKVAALSDAERSAVYENGLKLEEEQKAVVDVEVLPCLSIEDVQQAPKMQHVDVLKLNNVPTQVCNVQTNEISYLKCYFDGAHLSRAEMLLIPLFCNIINDMGTEKYDYRDFDKIVNAKTGGIDFKLHFAENIYDSKTFDLGVLMTTHALEKNTTDMFALCKELLTKFKLSDLERLKMLIDNYMSNICVGISNSGHLYAMQSCAGLVTDSAHLKSQMAGLEHIEYMKQYYKNNSIEQIKAHLQALGSKLFNKQAMRVAVNTSEEFYPQFVQSYESFLHDLPSTELPKVEQKVKLLQPSCQHFQMNIPVNFCAKSFFAVPYLHRDHPTLRLLAKLVSAKYLLPVVREQSGAYGAGAKLSSDGIFSFFSYRDPNSSKTLAAFDNTYNWLQENAGIMDHQALFEAKLGVLQQLDAPVAPGNLGIDFFLYGVTQEMFMKYRARLLQVKLTELRAVVNKYFMHEPTNYGKCILGPENKQLEKETKLKWKLIL